LTPRALRAVSLIGVSLIAVLVGSFAFLHEARPQPAEPVHVLGPGNDVDYSFVSPSTGWALITEPWSVSSRFSVFQTVDGSQHWTRQFSAPMQSGVASVHFFDGRQGMVSVLSSPSLIYETEDGGAHWDVVTLPRNVVTFVFSDQSHGWMETWLSSSGVGFRLFSTSDGGRLWVERRWPAAAVWGIRARYGAEVQYRDGGEGWVGGNSTKPTVYFTRDDGVTWQRLRLPAPAHTTPSYTTEVSLLPGGGVLTVVIDVRGDVNGFATMDGGQTWLALDRPAPSIHFSDFLFADAQHWWAMQPGGLYKTSDGGLTWRSVGAPNLVDSWEYAPHVIDATHAWAVMTRLQVGTGLAMTSDEGKTWRSVNVPQP
ncbi:MAG TPA: hypothetical protein VHO95_11570, partial [Candidatus Dormibacteraeota bacterium]|nr:hypothetical protein [Candidatus Dormibacteraeota bacterium]